MWLHTFFLLFLKITFFGSIVTTRFYARNTNIFLSVSDNIFSTDAVKFQNYNTENVKVLYWQLVFWNIIYIEITFLRKQTDIICWLMDFKVLCFSFSLQMYSLSKTRLHIWLVSYILNFDIKYFLFFISKYFYIDFFNTKIKSFTDSQVPFFLSISFPCF